MALFSPHEASKSTARWSSEYLSNATGHRARSDGSELDGHSEDTRFARLPRGIRPVTAKVAGLAQTNWQRTFPAILVIGSSWQRH